VKLDSLFKAFDALTTLRDAAREIKGGSAPPADPSSSPAMTAGAGGQIEARLTNLLVVALKEAFDRDHARLELERAHLEEQRRRAEEAARLEERRQAVDREVGRLRLLSGAAVVGWIASLLMFVPHVRDASAAARITFAGGCVLLLASLGASFIAQARMNSQPVEADRVPAMTVLWLLLAGLGVSVIAILL
jgi:hypothetical protein